MSVQSRKLFTNIMSFVILLITWWVVGGSVARMAVAMNGKFFENSLLLLSGLYINDFLPVFAAGALGLGWGIAIFVTSLIKSKSQLLPVLALLYLVFAIVGFAIYVSIDKVHYQVFSELFKLMFMLFLPGCVFGSLLILTQRFGNGEFV